MTRAKKVEKICNSRIKEGKLKRFGFYDDITWDGAMIEWKGTIEELCIQLGNEISDEV